MLPLRAPIRVLALVALLVVPGVPIFANAQLQLPSAWRDTPGPTADPGWIGILMADAPGVGVLVRGTVAGSPASTALQRGDVLTELDGNPLDDADALTLRLAAIPPGTRIALRIRRDDASHTVSLVVAQRPRDLAASAHGHTGRTAPVGELLHAATGAPATLPDGPHLIALWAEWCGACRQVEAALRDIAERCATTLPVYTVAPHDHETVRRLATRRNLPGTALADPENSLAEALSILALPSWIVIGPGQRIDTLIIGSDEIRAWVATRRDCAPSLPAD